MKITRMDDSLIDGRYVDPIPLTERITCIRAPAGAGKTRAIVSYAWQTDAQFRDVLIVVPRRSLADIYLRMFPFLSDYRKVTGKARVFGSAVICCDSLHKLGGPGGYGLIVFDEYQQIRRQTFGEHIKSTDIQAANHDMRKRLLAAGARVLICDALLSDEDLRDIRVKAGEDTGIELRTMDHPKTSWAISPSPSDITALIGIRAEERQRMAIFMAASPTKVMATAKMIGEKTGEPGKVLAITSDGIQSAAGTRVPIPTNDEQWRAWDHVLYSPALGTGVSIDVRGHFDHAMAFCWHRTVTAEEVYQGIRRVRHPKSSDFYLFIQSGGDTQPVTIAGIRKALDLNAAKTKARATKDAGANTLLMRDIGPWWGDVPLSSPIRDERIRVVHDIRSSGGLGASLLKPLIALIKDRLNGSFVDFSGDSPQSNDRALERRACAEMQRAADLGSETRASLRRLRRDAEDDRVAAILAARDVTPEEAKSSEMTDAEKQRWLVMKTHGRVTEELVRFSLKGGTVKVENWSHLWAEANGYKSALVAQDMADVARNDVTLDPRRRRVESVEMFRAIFDRIPGFMAWFDGARDSDFIIKHALIDKVILQVVESSEIRRRMQERRIYAKSPRRALGVVIRSLGIATGHSKQYVREDNPSGPRDLVRDMVLKAASADFMSGVSTCYRERLLEGVAPQRLPTTTP